MPGVLVERAVQGERVDLRQQFLQRQAIRPSRAPRNLPEQHTHAERFGQTRHGATELAMAEQAEGFALQFDDRVVEQAELFRLLPAACAHSFLIVGQARSEVEQQHDRVLRHRRRAVSLAIAHGDAVGAGGSEVDVVGAGGADQDQFQLRVGSHRGRVDHDFVGDRHTGAVQAFADLFRQSLGEQLQVAEAFAQRTEVQIAEIQRRVIKEYRAARVRHQLYLLCCERRAYPAEPTR